MSTMLILDTNILMTAANSPIFTSIQDEYPHAKLATTEGVLVELQGLSHGQSGEARAAKLGLQLAEKQALKILDESASIVDESLIAAATQYQAVLVTMDRALQKQALAAGVSVMTNAKGRIQAVHS